MFLLGSFQASGQFLLPLYGAPLVPDPAFSSTISGGLCDLATKFTAPARMAATAPAQRRSAVDRFLNVVERGGNALPHPAMLFALLAFLVIIASWIASLTGISVIHPATGAVVTPVNLLSIEGLHRIATSLVTNFTSFAPLGTVLVALIGIGVAEHSGLIAAGLRSLVLSAPKHLLTPIVVFAGILSNMASEVGYVLLVPLAAIAVGEQSTFWCLPATAGRFCQALSYTNSGRIMVLPCCARSSLTPVRKTLLRRPSTRSS